MSWLRNWLWLGVILGAIAAMAASVALGAPAAVEGVWLTNDATELTIAPCSAGYCGYVTKIVVPDRLKNQHGMDVTTLDPASYTDVNNKDPSLTSRPIQGLRILTLRATGDPSYFEGEIYNPEDGNTYSGSVEVLHPGAIRLKGCVMYVLCQEQQWARIGP